MYVYSRYFCAVETSSNRGQRDSDRGSQTLDRRNTGPSTMRCAYWTVVFWFAAALALGYAVRTLDAGFVETGECEVVKLDDQLGARSAAC